jgi:hypothetical protein
VRFAIRISATVPPFVSMSRQVSHEGRGRSIGAGAIRRNGSATGFGNPPGMVEGIDRNGGI